MTLLEKLSIDTVISAVFSSAHGKLDRFEAKILTSFCLKDELKKTGSRKSGVARLRDRSWIDWRSCVFVDDVVVYYAIPLPLHYNFVCAQ